MFSLINKDKRCQDCFFADFIGTEEDSILAHGFKCYLNPFKPVVMGLRGKHQQRKEYMKEQKEQFK